MRSWLKWTATGLLIGAFFSVAWWWLLEPVGDDDVVSELVIPDGTAAAVAAGQPAPFIPDKLVLARDGELRVVNRDSVDHWVGPFSVPAGTTALIRPESDTGSLACTIHPSGALGFGYDGRPPMLLMVLPTILIGLPIGLVCWIAASIGRRLDMEPAPPPGTAA